MTMPKASMHEYRGPTFRQHDVWRTGQGSIVGSVWNPDFSQCAPQSQLWSRIAAADGCHPPAHFGCRVDLDPIQSPLTPLRSTSPAIPTALARRGGTASPITLANNERATGLPGGWKSYESGKLCSRAAS